MPTKLKRVLLTLAAMFSLPLLLFCVLFLSTMGSYQVLPTVTQDPQLPQINIRGTHFHSEAFGSPQSPLLFVIHDGPGGDYRSLLALKSLSDRYRVVFYDQRGTGLSERVPETQLSIEQSLRDLREIIQHYQNGRPISLIGHGWGGMLASAYTGQHPQDVQRLILAEPGFLNTAMAQQILPAMNKQSIGFIWATTLNSVRSLHLRPIDEDARSDFVFQRIRFHPAYTCGQSAPDLEQSWRAGFQAWRTITRSTFNEKGQIRLDFTQGIQAYPHPVLFLVSECNTLNGRDFQARQSKLFSQAGIQRISKSGHELFRDNAEASVQAVRTFLNSGKLPPR